MGALLPKEGSFSTLEGIQIREGLYSFKRREPFVPRRKGRSAAKEGGNSSPSISSKRIQCSLPGEGRGEDVWGGRKVHLPFNASKKRKNPSRGKRKGLSVVLIPLCPIKDPSLLLLREGGDSGGKFFLPLLRGTPPGRDEYCSLPLYHFH